MKPREIQPFAGRSDAQVGNAMERVLDAERAAQSAIAACASECEEVLANTRKEARLILDRAHARIVALHTKAASVLAQQQILHQIKANPVARADAPQRDIVGFESAVASLADSLLNAPPEQM